MANFVLVHGGGHGGWCYKPVAQLLRAAGHTVYCPSLTGLGERDHLLGPDIDLETHIDDIVQLLFFEDIDDAIIVGHSYGGMVIAGIADRCPERVGHRVYLDAAYPDDGESLLDHAGEMIRGARALGEDRDGIELAMSPSMVIVEMMGITDPQMQQWALERLRPHPWKCFTQKLHFKDEARMRAIPESHIICSGTADSRDMERLTKAAEGRIWAIDTGHDLMLTEPDWVAERLGDVAATMGN